MAFWTLEVAFAKGLMLKRMSTSVADLSVALSTVLLEVKAEFLKRCWA